MACFGARFIGDRFRSGHSGLRGADVKGSIEPGKYADLTVLSDDIFTMPKENLKDVKALKTIVGGKVVYEAK